MTGALLEALDHFLEANLRAEKRRALAKIEQELEKSLATGFTRQGRIFVGRLAKVKKLFPKEEGPVQEAVKREDWEPLFEETTVLTRITFILAVEKAAKAALKAGVAVGVGTTGVSFDLKNPRAVEFLKGHAAERVTGIEEETRRRIALILRQGAERGWSYKTMAQAIKARFEEFASGAPRVASRAHLIAVTETAQAYEAGNRMVADEMRDSGIPMEKAWLTVGDERVDEEVCGPNQDVGWLPLEDAFPSGDQEPPGHPACRCTCEYRAVEEE